MIKIPESLILKLYGEPTLSAYGKSFGIISAKTSIRKSYWIPSARK
jgi:hypothetical protein